MPEHPLKRLYDGLNENFRTILDREGGPTLAELEAIRRWLKDNGYDAVEAGDTGVEYEGEPLEFPDHTPPQLRALGNDS